MGEAKHGTQCNRLLAYLRRGHSITPLQSWQELGIYRLAARIHDLRKDGHPIQDKAVKVPSRFGTTATVAQYSLPAVGQMELL